MGGEWNGGEIRGETGGVIRQGQLRERERDGTCQGFGYDGGGRGGLVLPESLKSMVMRCRTEVKSLFLLIYPSRPWHCVDITHHRVPSPFGKSRSFPNREQRYIIYAFNVTHPPIYPSTRPLKNRGQTFEMH